MVGLSVFIAIAFTRLPISRSRNIARTAKASTRLIASKFQDYRCDTKWDTVCDTRQHKRHRCLTYGWFFLTYRSASLFIKPRFGGVFAFWVSQMNDCPRRYAQKNAAYRSSSLFIKPRFDGFFAFWAGCYAWWRCAYQAYRDGWNGFCRPDKVFTPPSGRRYICRVTLGLTRLWRLFSLHLLFIWPLFMRWMSFIWGNAL